MRRAAIVIPVIALIAVLIGGCRGKESPVEQPAEKPVEIEAGEIEEYFPVDPGLRWEFEGFGNEFASFTMVSRYARGNLVQMEESNGGAVVQIPYRFEDGRLYRGTAVEDESAANILNEALAGERVVLEEPLKAGHSWTNPDGERRVILSVTTELELPYGRLKDVIKVEARREGVESVTYDYYARGIGLVMREFVDEPTGARVYSQLVSFGPYRESPGREVQLKLYFLRADGPSRQPALVLHRATLAQDSPEERLKRAVEVLLEDSSERGDGLRNYLAGRAQLISARIERPYAILNFSRELEQLGGTELVSGLLRQLAYTASEIDGVKAVVLEVNGRRVGTSSRPFTGDGFLFDYLRRPAETGWLKTLGPAEALDYAIVSRQDPSSLWSLLGPGAREAIGWPERIEEKELFGGFASRSGYEVSVDDVDADRAEVRLSLGDSVYLAEMVREGGVWKWDGPTAREDRPSPLVLGSTRGDIKVEEIKGLPDYFRLVSWLDDDHLLGQTGSKLIILNTADFSWHTLDVTAWWARPSPDGKKLVFANDRGIWLAGSDGTGVELILGEPAEAAGLPAGATWSPGSDRLLWWYQAEWDSFFYLYDLETGESSEVRPQREGFFLHEAVGFLDDNRAVFNARASRREDGTTGYSHGFRSDIIVLALDSGEITSLTETADGQYYTGLRVTPDGRILYRYSDETQSHSGIMKDDGERTEVAPGESGIIPAGPDLTIVSGPDEVNRDRFIYFKPEDEDPLFTVRYADVEPVVLPGAGGRLAVNTSADTGRGLVYHSYLIDLE